MPEKYKTPVKDNELNENWISHYGRNDPNTSGNWGPLTDDNNDDDGDDK